MTNLQHIIRFLFNFSTILFRMMTLKLSKLLVSCLMLLAAVVLATQINPVSLQYPVEAHHSLHPPLDHSQVYWIIGGSTVMTKKYLRLTPATQGRQGWVWNEYPVVSLDVLSWQHHYSYSICACDLIPFLSI
jgi:hypothetical protein